MSDKLRKEILKNMEKNSRIPLTDLARMLGSSPQVVAAEIHAMEAEKVICGYPAIIDWDKTGDEKVTALIEVKVSPKRGQGFEYMAGRIYKFPEVKSVYLMSADYDLMVVIEGKSMRDVAGFVASKLAPMDTVLSTATHFVLKKYKEHGMSYLEDEKDERQLITP